MSEHLPRWSTRHSFGPDELRRLADALEGLREAQPTIIPWTTDVVAYVDVWAAYDAAAQPPAPAPTRNYRIVRRYRDPGRFSEIIQENLTREEAVAALAEDVREGPELGGWYDTLARERDD